MMISNKVKYGAIIGGVALIIFAIARYLKVQAKLLDEITYKIVGFRLTNFQLTNITGEVTLQLTNISDVSIEINSIALDFNFNGKTVGYVESVNSFVLGAKSTVSTPLQFSLDATKVLSGPQDIILYTSNTQLATIELNGFASVKSGFISGVKPIKYTTTLADIF